MKNIVFNKEEFKKEVRNQVKVLYRRNIANRLKTGI